MSDLFIWMFGVEGSVKFMKHFQGGASYKSLRTSDVTEWLKDFRISILANQPILYLGQIVYRVQQCIILLKYTWNILIKRWVKVGLEHWDSHNSWVGSCQACSVNEILETDRAGRKMAAMNLTVASWRLWRERHPDSFAFCLKPSAFFFHKSYFTSRSPSAYVLTVLFTGCSTNLSHENM
jgi:hypothetical protein